MKSKKESKQVYGIETLFLTVLPCFDARMHEGFFLLTLNGQSDEWCGEFVSTPIISGKAER